MFFFWIYAKPSTGSLCLKKELEKKWAISSAFCFKFCNYSMWFHRDERICFIKTLWTNIFIVWFGLASWLEYYFFFNFIKPSVMNWLWMRNKNYGWSSRNCIWLLILVLKIYICMSWCIKMILCLFFFSGKFLVTARNLIRCKPIVSSSEYSCLKKKNRNL